MSSVVLLLKDRRKNGKGTVNFFKKIIDLNLILMVLTKMAIKNILFIPLFMVHCFVSLANNFVVYQVSITLFMEANS